MYLISNNKRIKITLIAITLLFISSSGFGQQKLTEGKIIYSIEVNKAGGLTSQAINAMEAGKLIFNFKNRFFRSSLNIGSTQHINIHDSKNHSGLSLIKAGNGKNYLIKMDRNALQQEAQKYEGMHYDLENTTKKIAGYTCHKAIGSLKNGKKFVVFYTKSLQPLYANYDPRFKGLEGLPLEFQFNINKANAQLTLTATEVKQGFQPSALFNTPTSGYRELTYNQLKSLRKNRQ